MNDPHEILVTTVHCHTVQNFQMCFEISSPKWHEISYYLKLFTILQTHHVTILFQTGHLQEKVSQQSVRAQVWRETDWLNEQYRDSHGTCSSSSHNTNRSTAWANTSVHLFSAVCIVVLNTCRKPSTDSISVEFFFLKKIVEQGRVSEENMYARKNFFGSFLTVK